MFESINALKKGVLLRIGNSGKYLINTSWLAVERIFRMAIAVIVGIWVARYLGPAHFGVLNYSQSLVGLVGAIATLGLDSIVTRALVNQPSKRNEILGTAFILKLAGAIIAIIVLLMVTSALQLDYLTTVIVFITSISLILQAFNVIDLHFQSLVSSKYVVLANFVASFLASLVKVIFIIADASLEAFAIALIVDQLLIAFGLIYYFRRQGQRISRWTFNKSLVKGYLTMGWPLILSGISISIGMRIDQVMIKSMIDDKHVGLYAVGVKLAEVFNFIPMIIGQSFFPKLIEMNLSIDSGKLVPMIRYVFYMLAFLALFVNGTSYIAITILYGKDYYLSQPVLDILIWAVPITFLNIITNSIMLKMGESLAVLKRQVISATVNILLNMVLLPKYGIVGAAFATLIAESSVLLVEFFTPRYRWIFELRMKAIFFKQ